MPTELRSELLLEVEVDLGAADDWIDSASPPDRVVVVTGGKFAGPQLHGTVLPGVGEFLVRVEHSDGRLVLRTHDGELVYMTYDGGLGLTSEMIAAILRGAKPKTETYRYRTVIGFSTSARAYTWLSDALSVGIGRWIVDADRIAVGCAVHRIL